MFEPIERTAVLIAMNQAAEPALAAALGGMGMDLPKVGRITEAGGLVLARMAPHQVLAMRQGSDGGLMDELAPLASVAGLIDQSDARVGVRLTGPGVRARLGLLVPIDLDATQFGAGQCAQTVLSHLSVLVLCLGGDVFELHCGRSFAGSFFRSVEAAMETIAA